MNLDFYLDFVAVDFDLEFPPNLFRNTDFDRVPHPTPSSTSDPLARAWPRAMSRSATSCRESSDFLLISSLGTSTPDLGGFSLSRELDEGEIVGVCGTHSGTRRRATNLKALLGGVRNSEESGSLPARTNRSGGPCPR